MPDFDAWLLSHNLDAKTIQMIKAGLCFADADGNKDSQSKWKALGLYLHSVGRLRADSGAFIVPLYSASDVPQVHAPAWNPLSLCHRLSVASVLSVEACMF